MQHSINNRASRWSLALLILAMAWFAGVGSANAAETADAKVVFQVSSGDSSTQNLVLNNAANLQKELGIQHVTIEVVAYGPGLGMLTTGSPFRDRVEAMAKQNVRFSACENTMAAVERKTGHKPQLAAGVGTVPSGVARIVELQQEGYAYVRP